MQQVNESNQKNTESGLCDKLAMKACELCSKENQSTPEQDCEYCESLVLSACELFSHAVKDR